MFSGVWFLEIFITSVLVLRVSMPYFSHALFSHFYVIFLTCFVEPGGVFLEAILLLVYEALTSIKSNSYDSLGLSVFASCVILSM